LTSGNGMRRLSVGRRKRITLRHSSEAMRKETRTGRRCEMPVNRTQCIVSKTKIYCIFWRLRGVHSLISWRIDSKTRLYPKTILFLKSAERWAPLYLIYLEGDSPSTPVDIHQASEHETVCLTQAPQLFCAMTDSGACFVAPFE
jgi:hypothetical protein